NAQQVSDFFTAFTLGNGQDGSETLVDTPVKGFLAASFDAPSLLGIQDNRFHDRRCEPWDKALPLALLWSMSIVAGARFAFTKGAEGFKPVCEPTADCFVFTDS